MIYFAQLTTGAIKIGTTEDLDGRLAGLGSYYGEPPALLGTMPGGREREREIHARFAHLRLGRTEQFRPASDLMTFIGKPVLVGANPDAVEMAEPVSKPTVVTIKGNPEWRDWVDKGARHCRTDVAKLIDAAVVDYLRARGFTEEAPER